MNIPKRFTVVLLAAVALLGLGLVIKASWKTPERDIAADFPKASGTRVELPPKDGEEIRYVYFADDKVTRTMTQIEFRSGVTSFTYYRPDGSKKESRSFFPLRDGASKRQLRSLITYADDGGSYVSHQVYHEDGSLERNGGRLSEGGYQTLYFNGKDGSVQRRLVFSAESALEFEESFSEEGKLVEKTEKVTDYTLRTTRWSADGKKLSEIDDNTDGTREGKLYHEDGETVKVEFTHRGYGIEVEYFDATGEHTLSLEYGTDGMIATTFGPGDKALFKQYFAYAGGKTICDAQFKLVKVEEFHKWGTNQWDYQMKRVIGIADDGKPNRVITPTKGQYNYERTDAELHPDGSVKSVKEFDDRNQVSSTKTFAPGAQKLDLKPELFVKPTFECLDPPESKVKLKQEVEESED